jgi:DNA-binding CsgD family transcriptional regulator
MDAPSAGSRSGDDEDDRSAAWEPLRRLASTLLPAQAWRDALARELHRVTGCPSVVFTCSPAAFFASKHGCSTPGVEAFAQGTLRTYMQHMIHDEAWVRHVGDRGTVFATDAAFEGLPSKRKLHRSAARLGVAGFVQAFAFAYMAGPPVVWTVLLCREPPAEVARRFGGLLHDLSLAMGAHVATALELAHEFGNTTVPGSWSRLSLRERQIALLVTEGNSNLNVAAKIGISEGTVAVHLRRIYRKFGIHSRTQLANAVFGTAP